MTEKEKQSVDEFIATHPVSKWPRFLVVAKEEADKRGMTVQAWLDATRTDASLLDFVPDDE